MEKSTIRIAVGTSIAAAGMLAAGIAHMAVVNKLGKIAFDRKCPDIDNPKKRDRVRGSTGNEAFELYLKTQGEALKEEKLQTVTITADDGIQLVGHWYQAENARRVIVAMHGWRSSWHHDFGMVFPFFKDQKCSVLFAEQRGQSESGGEYIGFGVLERFDCQKWAQWAAKQTQGKLPIYLAGISMGATTVMMASELELPQQVKGIIADCGFTSIRDIGNHVIKNNLNMRLPVPKRAIDNLCKKRFQAGAGEYSTVHALQNTTVPVLLAHGQEDCFVPVRMSYENFGACKGPRELLIVPRADHGMCYYLDPGRYEATVLSFWSKYDD